MKNHLTGNPLAVIIFTLFLDTLGFGILIPVIPQLLANPHSPYFLLKANMSVQDGYIILGFLSGIFPLMQFIATPILGQLSDKYGRKNILSVSIFGTFLSYIMFAFGIITRNLPLLFISRGFDGITGGNISVAQAAIADITQPDHRAKNFGLMGAAFGVGFILGPYIGGKLSDPTVVSWFSAVTPFWFAAILSFVNFFCILFLYPETLKVRRTELRIEWSRSLHNILHAFNFPKLRLVFISNFLFWCGFTFFVTFFSVFLINRFNFSQGQIGDYFSYVGLWIAFSQIVVTRRVSHYFSEWKILRYSIFGAGLFIMCYFIPTVWWGLLFVVPLFAICNGLTQANMSALISRSVDRTIQGEVLGINASVMALGQSIPPIISGYIAARLSPESPIVVSSIVMMLAGVIFYVFYRPFKEPIHQPL